ncbi:ankyrin repeat and mynd domain-containing protein 1 [Plakobranchus ocellatus]|uniref:Alkaline ceramidase n=1 Tax=Plakobranchus ocellatus TaxID=259542 RepID=A0AAV3XVN0_9GAST|nr:ankyrin repeat and mynd domain-containing protein 1 [Plakobranchus ocellatus]
MAPQMGFWERHTSTIDWCEENYVVTKYIAEFWNTLSNFVLIGGPFIMLSQCFKNNLERRFVIAFSLISVIGVGSLLFHMTLQYSMQVLFVVAAL